MADVGGRAREGKPPKLWSNFVHGFKTPATGALDLLNSPRGGGTAAPQMLMYIKLSLLLMVDWTMSLMLEYDLTCFKTKPFIFDSSFEKRLRLVCKVGTSLA